MGREGLGEEELRWGVAMARGSGAGPESTEKKPAGALVVGGGAREEERAAVELEEGGGGWERGEGREGEVAQGSRDEVERGGWTRRSSWGAGMVRRMRVRTKGSGR